MDGLGYAARLPRASQPGRPRPADGSQTMNGDKTAGSQVLICMAVALLACLVTGCYEGREHAGSTRSPAVSAQQPRSGAASDEAPTMATASDAAQTRPAAAPQPARRRTRSAHDPLHLCPDIGPFDDIGKIKPEEITGLKDALEQWKKD